MAVGFLCAFGNYPAGVGTRVQTRRKFHLSVLVFVVRETVTSAVCFHPERM